MNKSLDTCSLVNYFIQNMEKDSIISGIFDFFRLDCLERCNVEPERLDALIRQFDSDDRCDPALLAEIIETVKLGREGAQKKENDLIKSIISYISQNLAADISIEGIANALHISYHYMCHIFKDKYGISVNTFRNQKRLELAMRKLVEGNEKISEIGLSCGFNTISYFTETFSKMVGITPTEFRSAHKGIRFHEFYTFEDMLLAVKIPNVHFMASNVTVCPGEFDEISLQEPDDRFGFLHEAAIIEYHGVLYASWYNCPQNELQGYTPICGKRSYDGGKTWTELEILCQDPSGKILYCPPVYGICDDKLYMLVNQMVAPDHMHALELYVLNTDTDCFELLWSRPIPFKLNTNVITLPNGKLMLPGRVAELDGFPNTPAVLISDSGKIDTQWRLVKIAENGDLPDGKKLVHPEISVMCVDDVLYMFCRNDQRKVPLVYISKDFGESWSSLCGHDIPYISSKVYAGNLSDGRKYLVCNVDKLDRSKLAVYFTEKGGGLFQYQMVLFDQKTTNIPEASACHYPAAYEADGKLYIIATRNYEWSRRGAVLFIVDLNKARLP